MSSAAAPAGTSGTNFSVTLPNGVHITGAAIVGEAVPAQVGTVNTPSGTVLQVRHGFFPGNQAPISGSG